MTEERARTILLTYGAQPARWPAEEREALRAMIEAPTLRAALAEAKALDAALASAAADAGFTPDLKAAIMAHAPRLAMNRPLAMPGRLALAFAACAVFGLVTGIGAAQFAPNATDQAELEALVAGALAPADGVSGEGATDG
jgi:hypothetical protein